MPCLSGAYVTIMGAELDTSDGLRGGIARTFKLKFMCFFPLYEAFTHDFRAAIHYNQLFCTLF